MNIQTKGFLNLISESSIRAMIIDPRVCLLKSLFGSLVLEQ